MSSIQIRGIQGKMYIQVTDFRSHKPAYIAIPDDKVDEVRELVDQLKNIID